MNLSKKYVSKLESVIKQMLKPLKGLPFSLVIEGICGKKIIPFDKTDKRDAILLKKLTTVVDYAGRAVNRSGIKRPRPNEVGNDIEPFVIEALKKVFSRADRPKSRSGNKKSVGYPDIEFTDEFGRVSYILSVRHTMLKI